MSKLTHFDADGRASMVDVSAKPKTDRMALAEGSISMAAETLALIRAGGAQKGDVLSIAQLAGIMGAKQTANLIPLCHPLTLSHIDVKLTCADTRVVISAACRLNAQTGVEMEALTAVAIAALTVYDMVKAVDKSMVIGDIRLVEKSGGRSGHFKTDA